MHDPANAPLTTADGPDKLGKTDPPDNAPETTVYTPEQETVPRIVIKSEHDLQFRAIPKTDAEWTDLMDAMMQAVKGGAIMQNHATHFISKYCNNKTVQEVMQLQNVLVEGNMAKNVEWQAADKLSEEAQEDEDTKLRALQSAHALSKNARKKFWAFDAELQILDGFVTALTSAFEVKTHMSADLEAKDEQLAEMERKATAERQQREEVARYDALLDDLLARRKAAVEGAEAAR